MFKTMTIFVQVLIFAQISYGAPTADLVHQMDRINKETTDTYQKTIQTLYKALEIQKQLSWFCFQAGKTYDKDLIVLNDLKATNPQEAQKLTNYFEIVENNCKPPKQ